ncbi:hypothetical protein [Undibacterium sp. Ji22W]|uniref:hypothetical protein n=1 Tax=Undibacterium sp. Ji22W TaxID=3413038 RepID=UPI003BF309BD
MNFRFVELLSLMILMLPFTIRADQASRIEFVRSKLAQNESAILIEKGAQIIIVGEITPALAVAFKKGILEDKEIKLVRVDSPGGDVESALALAKLMKNNHLSLIVDGRCFSACANYLFPAAVSKTVLPGSLVAIHEKTFWYFDSKRLQKVAYLTSGVTSLSLSSMAARIDFEKIRQKETAFLKELVINQDLHTSFLNFLSSREEFLGRGQMHRMFSPISCREIRVWGLNEHQLASMGVKGIRSFWFPSNVEEKNMLYKYFKLPLGSIYFGERSDLLKSCTLNNYLYRNLYDVNI